MELRESCDKFAPCPDCPQRQTCLGQDWCGKSVWDRATDSMQVPSDDQGRVIAVRLLHPMTKALHRLLVCEDTAPARALLILIARCQPSRLNALLKASIDAGPVTWSDIGAELSSQAGALGLATHEAEMANCLFETLKQAPSALVPTQTTPFAGTHESPNDRHQPHPQASHRLAARPQHAQGEDDCAGRARQHEGRP